MPPLLFVPANTVAVPLSYGRRLWKAEFIHRSMSRRYEPGHLQLGVYLASAWLCMVSTL
jgi:hypothetical protein